MLSAVLKVWKFFWKNFKKSIDFLNDMFYNSYRCKFGSNYILWNSVTVARQTLTLFVGVRIPIPQPIPRNNLFRGFFMPEYCFLRRYSAIFLCFKAFGHFFFALKYRESLWEILRDSKFQNSKSVLVRFRAFMTETFERHRLNQNRNTNWNEQKIWETFQKI